MGNVLILGIMLFISNCFLWGLRCRLQWAPYSGTFSVGQCFAEFYLSVKHSVILFTVKASNDCLRGWGWGCGVVFWLPFFPERKTKQAFLIFDFNTWHIYKCSFCFPCLREHCERAIEGDCWCLIPTLHPQHTNININTWCRHAHTHEKEGKEF